MGGWGSGWDPNEQSCPGADSGLKLRTVCRQVHDITHFTSVNGWGFHNKVLFVSSSKGYIL